MLQTFRQFSYQRQVLIIYIFAIFMTVIDGTMVNVALPTLADEFNVIAADAEFVAVGYLLAVASVIPAAGWLGDRFGTRRVFITSLVLFVLTSLLCGLAQSLDQLVLFRVLQGFGGGLMAPVGSTIMFRAFPLSERATAATAVLSVAVVAPATGPVLGGVLVDAASWHWIFLINLPIGALAIALAVAGLREEKQDHPGRLDWLGLLLSAGSVASLLYAMSQGPERGWLDPLVLVLGVGGAIGLVALVYVETHIDEPLLALRLLQHRLFRGINISAAFIYGGFFGFIFVLPIYLQSLRGYSAFMSGLVQSPQAVGIFIVSNTVGKWAYRRVGPRRLIVVGGVMSAACTLAFAGFGLDTPLWIVAAFSFLRGFGVGFVFIAIQTAVYARTSVADTGRAASLFNTQRQISFASGVAIGATVIAALLPADEAAPAIEQVDAYRYAFAAMGLLMLPGAVAALWLHDEDVAETRGLEVPPDASAVTH